MVMNHFRISIVKSILRIVGCVCAGVLASLNLLLPSLITVSSALCIAELLGILEEIYDKRKE